MPKVAELKDQVDRIGFASFQTDLADTLTQQLRQHARLGVPAARAAALREAVASYRDHLRTPARAAARTPSPFRCAGHYQRRVLTSYGLIPDLRVPKLRSGNAARPWQILRRSHLAMQPVLDLALSLSTLGLSIRDLQEALDLTVGHVLSREAVKRVTIAAQSPMPRWRERPITDPPPLLIVDGVWVQILAPTGPPWIDRSGSDRQQMRGVARGVLAVMGVWEAGRHEMLHDEAADAESSESWAVVRAALTRRGLDSTAVRMVVSDGTTGVPAAIAQPLPTAQQQRWTVHKIRGLERQFC